MVQCYKCLRLGHVSKQCKGTQRCYNCGGPHNYDACEDKEKLFCVLCKTEGHKSTNKECPEFKKAKLVKEHMALNGVPYKTRANT